MPKDILIVEDDDLSRFVISEMCHELGYQCTVAINGQDCLDILNNDPESICMILMDIHMPKVSGLEATMAIRNSDLDPPRTTPIVAVSADVHWHNPHRCKEHGFDSVLPKPVTMMGLSETLQQLAS